MTTRPGHQTRRLTQLNELAARLLALEQEREASSEWAASLTMRVQDLESRVDALTPVTTQGPP